MSNYFRRAQLKRDDAFVSMFLSTVYDCIVFVLPLVPQWRNKE